LAVTTTNPSFTTEEATALAAQVQMVSSWTTRFIPGISNFNGENIRVPAKILNGTIVEPGERFSFLDAVGEISPANGFGLGGAIIRGHTREQGAIGGGICSASTTMFNAVLRYGYQIDARTQHAYYIDRYPVGLDATVFRSAGQTVDMAFINDSQYPLWIRGIARRSKVTFQIWTIPDGRTVKIGRPDISNRRPAQDTTQVVDTMKPGTSKRVEYPVNGFDATLVRVVYDAGGAVLHTDTFSSHYIMVTGITQVGPSPEPPPSPQPPPSEPPPTEPPPTEPPPAP
jgi:vancomycin resistance protein YoaR